MILKQNEIDVITELQTQEKNCVEKYRRYKEQAKDEELKNLFGEIEQLEQSSSRRLVLTILIRTLVYSNLMRKQQRSG